MITSEAAVRRQHHVVEALDWDHRRAAREIAAGTMARQQIAREDAGDLVIAIQCDVEIERHICARSDVAHGVVNRVPLDDSPRNPRP